MAAPSSWSRAVSAADPGLAVGIGLGPRLELAADAIAQLRSGLLGEGDGGDGPQFGVARRHQGHDPVDQGRRLPRSRPRLHEQGGAEIAGDPVPTLLVGRRAHVRPVGPLCTGDPPDLASHGCRVRDGWVAASQSFRCPPPAPIPRS